MMIPPQVEGQLHILEIPTMDDISNLLGNGTLPENIRMFHYWMMKIDEKANLLNMVLTYWDDAVFLGAIEWDWFCQELAYNAYKRAKATDEG